MGVPPVSAPSTKAQTRAGRPCHAGHRVAGGAAGGVIHGVATARLRYATRQFCYVATRGDAVDHARSRSHSSPNRARYFRSRSASFGFRFFSRLARKRTRPASDSEAHRRQTRTTSAS